MRNRLIIVQLGLWVVIGVLVVNASLAVQAASRGRQRARALAQHVTTAEGLNVDLRRFSEASHRYLLTGDPRDRVRVKELEVQFRATGTRAVESVRQLDGEPSADNLEKALNALTSTHVQLMVSRPSKTEGRPFEPADVLEAAIPFEAALATGARDLDEALAPVRSTLHHAMTVAFERADQLERRAQWTILVTGAVSLVLGVAFTLSVLRELVRQSHHARAASEVAGRAASSRRDLIAASHSLRDPLATIVAQIATLTDTKQRDPAELEALASIASAARRVDELVVSLLDVSRLQNGTVTLRSERCGADVLVERATRALARTANERAIRLRAVAKATPVYADPDRIVHVLTMLIELAMTVVRVGSEITVGASPTEDAVRFTITSNQLGALPESLAQMFGPDPDPDPPVDRPRLEVYLCRRVIEAHGGRVGVELRPGQSTASWFELPVEPRVLGREQLPSRASGLATRRTFS